MVPHYWGCCKDGMGQHPSDMGQQCPAQDVLRQCEHRPPGLLAQTQTSPLVAFLPCVLVCTVPVWILPPKFFTFYT